MWCTPSSCIPLRPNRPSQTSQDGSDPESDEHCHRDPWALRPCTNCYRVSNLCELRRCTPRVDCIVHEVKVERHRQPAPVFEWLMGHEQLLYVEVRPIDSANEAKKTATCVRLREGQDGEMREELWSWKEAPSKAGGKVPAPSGLLVFNELKAMEFALRVLGSYMTWHMALALHVPLEPLGEARFKVNDCDLGSNIYVPIQSQGRVCGYVMLIVKAHHVPGGSDRVLWQDMEVNDFDEEGLGALKMQDLRPFPPT